MYSLLKVKIYSISIGVTLASMMSQCQIQDGGSQGVTVAGSKMMPPTESDLKWQPQRSQI